MDRFPLRRSPRAGFTLVELLIGATLALVAVAAAARVLVSHINTTNATAWSLQIQRDLSKFNFLVTSEANEACRLQRGNAPANDTDCTAGTAAAPFSCATFTGTATTLNLLVPIPVANADPVERVITYRFDAANGRVLRDGPRILNNGQLDTTVANNQNNAVVLDGVTTFTPVVSADCRTATIDVTLTVPTTTSPVSQQILVAAGAPYYTR